MTKLQAPILYSDRFGCDPKQQQTGNRPVGIAVAFAGSILAHVEDAASAAGRAQAKQFGQEVAAEPCKALEEGGCSSKGRRSIVGPGIQTTASAEHAASRRRHSRLQLWDSGRCDCRGVADEAVRCGARRTLSFACAVVAASLLSALILTSMWFDLAWRSERSLALFIPQNTMQTGLWAGLAIIVLYNSAQTARIRQGVKQAQMNRVQIERGVLEARLDAVRKQIDGPALFRE